MIVDRIEGELAVVELDKGKFVDIPVKKISGRVRDGAVLVNWKPQTYVREALFWGGSSRGYARPGSLIEQMQWLSPGRLVLVEKE